MSGPGTLRRVRIGIYNYPALAARVYVCIDNRLQIPRLRMTEETMEGLKYTKILPEAPDDPEGIRIETPGGIVKIRCLKDDRNRSVVHIDVGADGVRFDHNAPWWAAWGTIDKHGGAVRLVQHVKEKKS